MQDMDMPCNHKVDNHFMEDAQTQDTNVYGIWNPLKSASLAKHDDAMVFAQNC